MRNIVSTNTYVDVDPELSGQLKELIDAAPSWSVLRETYDNDEVGQKVYRIRVVEFLDPETGKVRWAMAYEDPASVEYEDYDTAEAASARYVEVLGSQILYGATYQVSDLTDEEIEALRQKLNA